MKEMDSARAVLSIQTFIFYDLCTFQRWLLRQVDKQFQSQSGLKQERELQNYNLKFVFSDTLINKFVMSLLHQELYGRSFQSLMVFPPEVKVFRIYIEI